jgi:hypothetical protein
MTEECGAVKHGVIDLRCALERGHDEANEERPATWHWATVIQRSDIEYPGAHHEIEQTETVTWAPVDHAEEAVRHMLAGRKRQAGRLLATTQERHPSREVNLITDDEREDDAEAGL